MIETVSVTESHCSGLQYIFCTASFFRKYVQLTITQPSDSLCNNTHSLSALSGTPVHLLIPAVIQSANHEAAGSLSAV